MTAPIDDDALAKAAAEHVAEITALYHQMRKSMRVWIAKGDEPTIAMTKEMLRKISEIQSAFMLVLKAEDAFHDLQKSNTHADEPIDLGEIRAEIGRKIDGLCAAIVQSGIHK